MNENTKTDSVRTKVFRAILHGDFVPGEKLPTEREMATRAGTSRVTVRRAYEQLEKAGILLREQGRGTFVADHSGGNPANSGQIALLSSVSDPFALEFIKAVEIELTAADMLLVLRLTDETPEKEEQAAIELVGKGVSNLIIWPSGLSFSAQTFKRLRVLGANMVFFDRVLPGDYADYVGLDNADAMNKLFNRASLQKIKNPVFVTHSNLQADSDKMREAAFLQNCKDRRLAGQVIALQQRNKISALPEGIAADSTVFCVNDAMALKLRPFLNKQQLFGIDGLTDDIVSCCQPMGEMAGIAVSMLLKQQKKGAQWKASKKYCKGELINA